jgi:LysM repeat protein
MHGIYFSANNDNEGFRLPVNPEKVAVSSSGDGENYTISKIGNVNIPKDVKLETYSIETFFPTQEYSFLVASFREPEFYISMIKKWQSSKLPVRYMYVNGSFTINELVTIEEFNYDETGGSTDVNFSLSLKKYVNFEPNKMKVIKAGNFAAPSPVKVIKKSAPPRQNKKEELKTYSLKSGDTLWTVAQKHLGSGSRYTEIQKLNGIKDSQLRSLPIGLKLKLPKK